MTTKDVWTTQEEIDKRNEFFDNLEKQFNKNCIWKDSDEIVIQTSQNGIDLLQELLKIDTWQH